MQDALINSIFQPDSVAGAQFDETMQRSTPLEPEKKLMLAVLEDAVMCFQDNVAARDKKKRQLFDETELWIFGERSDRLFAFESVCQQLNLDPYYVRNGLRRWRESRLGRRVGAAPELEAGAPLRAAAGPLKKRRGAVKKYRSSIRHREQRALMAASRFRA